MCGLQRSTQGPYPTDVCRREQAVIRRWKDWRAIRLLARYMAGDRFQTIETEISWFRNAQFQLQKATEFTINILKPHRQFHGYRSTQELGYMCYHSEAPEAMRVPLCNQPHSPSCRGSKCLFPVRSPRFVTRQSAYPGWRTLRCRSWLLPSVRVRLALSRQVKSYFVKRIHLGEYARVVTDSRRPTCPSRSTQEKLLRSGDTQPPRKQVALASLLVVSLSRCAVTTSMSQLFCSLR